MKPSPYARRRPHLPCGKWAHSSGAFQVLAAQGQSLNGDVVALGAERRTIPFARPGSEEIPAHLLRARVVKLHNRAVAAFDLSVDRLHVPVVEFVGVGGATLQRDVGTGALARKLAHAVGIAAFAILDHLQVRTYCATFGESGLSNALNLHAKPHTFVWITIRHVECLPLLCSFLQTCAGNVLNDLEDDEFRRRGVDHSDLDN